MSSTIRMATPEDAAAVAEIYRPAVAGSFISFELEPPTAGEMASRIRGVLALLPWLVCEVEGQVVGYAYAARHRERAAYRFCVDLAVYVREGWRGRGVGRALYGSLLPLLRLQGHRAAHAGVTLPNEASVGLHEAIGMRCVGVYPKVGWKLGGWYDVGWWQLELLPREGVPEEPLSMDRLAASAGFEEALGAGVRFLR